MTDEQAWRRIAAAYERLAETGRENEVTKFGLCHALDVVLSAEDRGWYNSRAHRALESRMMPRDRLVLAPFWHNEPHHDAARLRATVALLMAELAADDGGNHKEE